MLINFSIKNMRSNTPRRMCCRNILYSQSNRFPKARILLEQTHETTIAGEGHRSNLTKLRLNERGTDEQAYLRVRNSFELCVLAF
jgi:hypothetical protein